MSNCYFLFMKWLATRRVKTVDQLDEGQNFLYRKNKKSFKKSEPGLRWSQEIHLP